MTRQLTDCPKMKKGLDEPESEGIFWAFGGLTTGWVIEVLPPL